MFPADWGERKGSAANKRRKVQPKETLGDLIEECDKAQAAGSGDRSGLSSGAGACGGVPLDGADGGALDRTDSIVDIIKRRVNDSRFAPAMPVELQLDHVLSSVPYQAMLESLFGGVSEPACEVPLVTKSYEESFMREPAPGEQPSSMGEQCECQFIDKNAPFVGVQFELPGARAAQPDRWARMCVLCYRKTTQRLFYDACYSGRRVQGLIQHYGNLCNQPGEYARCCMLICPPGSQWQCMPLPIMSHQRNRYRVHVVAGVKHLQQLRVAHEDFATPSDRTQA
jgi:hypothetical protein